MILPPDFLATLEPEAAQGFLENLLVASCGADAYSGDLAADRQRLLQQIEAGQLLVEFSEEEETFRLLTPDELRLKTRTTVSTDA